MCVRYWVIVMTTYWEGSPFTFTPGLIIPRDLPLQLDPLPNLKRRSISNPNPLGKECAFCERVCGGQSVANVEPWGDRIQRQNLMRGGRMRPSAASGGRWEELPEWEIS